jgi:hypothetical protein
MKIIPILIGGLGNRLYQIANAFRLQELYNSDLEFYKIKTENSDVSKYRSLILREKDFDDFGGHDLIIKENLPKTISELFPNLNWNLSRTKIDDILLNRNLIYENNINSINPSVDSVIMGYFFSFNFIENQIGKIKKSINKNVNDYVINKYPDLFNKKILGIHLRLGIDTDNTPAVYVPKDFYNQIISTERNNFDKIYIVSDNINRAKEYINSLNIEDKIIEFIEDEPMYVDMLILSHCTTLIVAPSTLSAWSSYLNNHKNIYVPNIWIKHHWTNNIPKEWKIL